MNCLWADPTTEKELPLIDATAKAGCEYFVIDAGFFAGIPLLQKMHLIYLPALHTLLPAHFKMSHPGAAPY